MTLEEFVRQQVSQLIDRLEFEIRRAATEHGADAIHDLRVAIRRLTQALRAFRSLFGKQPVRQVRSRLREVMDIAAEIRSRDIALELFQAADIPSNCPAGEMLRKERDKQARKLRAKLRLWRREEVWRQWRQLLSLPEVAP